MKKLLIFFFFASAVSLVGQKRPIKDDPRARSSFELLKYKDPATGRIPANIRSRELDFASGMRARTGDASTVWEHRGPFNVGGRTRALAVSSMDENMILAGGVSGGVWRSTNQGTSWTKVSSTSDLLSITCIAQDTRTGQTDTWYYGTGEWRGNSASGDGAPFRGDGIYKSTDNGLTWSVLAATVSETPETFEFGSYDYNHEIVVNPTNGNVFVANYFGIQRSGDGGTSFTEVLTNTNGQWTDIVVSSSGDLFAAIDGTGIFKSTDNGDNWTEISNGAGIPFFDSDRIELALSPSNENILYVLGEANTRDMSGSVTAEGHMLWKFDDSDDSWMDHSLNIPMIGGDVGDFDSQRGYDLLVKVSPDDENLVVIGGTNLHRSTDGFESDSNTDWIGGYSPLNDVSTYNNQHPDQHAFLFLSGNKAISGNDGGIHLTNDITDATANGDGETVDWVSLNSGYLTTQVYAVSVGPGDQIISGFQDNGNWLTNSPTGTDNWGDDLVNFFGGDGAYNAFSKDGLNRYISTQNARIFRVEYADADDLVLDGFEQIDPTVNSYFTSLFITPFYVDLVNDDIFYLGGDIDLFVNTQASTATRSTGWKSITLGNTDVISEFGLTNANLVYVGTANGELFKVQDVTEATPTVTNITDASFPSGYVSSIGVNPFDENELMVVFSNYEVPSIFHSEDGGMTWKEIGGNLEENTDGTGNGPSVRAARIIGDGFEYYVGTSTGLYSTRLLDEGNTVWVLEGDNTIGNVVVSHVVTRDDGQMVIGTHGNGIYSAVVPFGSDLTVTSLDAPESTPLPDMTDVVVTLTNIGGLATTSFDISLTIDGNLIVTDNVVTAVGVSETYQHTFTTPFNFSVLGDYEIEISVSNTGDTDPTNDMLTQTITSESAPTDIGLSNATIAEEEDSGTSIGTLTTLGDEDDTEHTYSLVDGDGDDDNASFSISDNELVSAEVFDFETKVTYLIRLETADDDGNTFAKAFSIEVTDVLAIDEDNAGITMYPNPFSDRLNLEMVNEYIGAIDIRIFSLDGKQLIFQKSYNKQQQRTSSLLDLRTIPDGSYIVKFTLGDQKISSKLIKEHSKK